MTRRPLPRQNRREEAPPPPPLPRLRHPSPPPPPCARRPSWTARRRRSVPSSAPERTVRPPTRPPTRPRASGFITCSKGEPRGCRLRPPQLRWPAATASRPRRMRMRMRMRRSAQSRRVVWRGGVELGSSMGCEAPLIPPPAPHRLPPPPPPSKVLAAAAALARGEIDDDLEASGRLEPPRLLAERSKSDVGPVLHSSVGDVPPAGRRSSILRGLSIKGLRTSVGRIFRKGSRAASPRRQR